MNYLIKEVTPRVFQIWHKVKKRKITLRGWKRWEEFEQLPFYNLMTFKGRIYNNSFSSMKEAEDFLKAKIEYENHELREKLIQL